MAQVSRALRRAFLGALPAPVRTRLLESYPNLRKAAPEGMRFVFLHYLGDIAVNIDTRFKVERIMWSGVYEPPLIRLLQSLDTRGWTCFDVGANVGAITLALAKVTGADGRIYSFEPGPPNLRRLRDNLNLNPALSERVVMIAAGVGRSPGELCWAEEKGNPGNALLGKSGTHETEIITLDGFVRERGIAKLDFVKIDVEGMELDVMQGAAEILRRFHPMLYFETLPRYTETGAGATFEDMYNFLVKELGYTLHRIDSEGQLHPQDPRHHGGYTVALHPKNA
ncbi:MAG TPA: FkbM family methyltransferase [Terriglobales bacterium]|nr:FkbM family methyltransferase [Terriglobales bacterium]